MPERRKQRKPMIPAQSSGAACSSAKAFGNRIDEILGRHGVLGVSAVHRVAGEVGWSQRFSIPARQYSQVWSVLCSQAIPTRAPIGNRRAPSPSFSTIADDLVPGNHRRFARRQFAFNHVQIRAAYAAHLHANENFAFARLRSGTSVNTSGFVYRRGRMKKASFHRGTIPYLLTAHH